jgi:carbonic anhydrase
LIDRFKVLGIDRHRLPENLTEYFGVFASEQQNVIHGVDLVRHSPIIGAKIPVHGLMVDTVTGKLDWIVNGYDVLDRPVAPAPLSPQMTAIGAAAGELLSRASAELSGLKTAEAKIGQTTNRVSQWVSDLQAAASPPQPPPKIALPSPAPPPVELRRRIPVPPRIEPPPKHRT